MTRQLHPGPRRYDLIVLLGLSALWAPVLIAAEVASSAGLAGSCGPLRPVPDLGGWLDYRLAGSDERVANGVQTIDRFHTSLAEREIVVRRTSKVVISNLDFTLRHSPNHHRALKLLIDYDLAGGRSYEFPRTECYFAWARGFAPEDSTVRQLEALYFWKEGNLDQAGVLYKEALEIDPGSAELNYNAGLFYFEIGEYENARRHARAAYAAGYPLPGLMNKLKKAGQWSGAPSTGSNAP